MRRKRRVVRKKSTPQNKKVRNATEVELGGIKYRSKLELYTATRLKDNDIPFDYEKHKFPLMEKFTYLGEIYEPHKIKGKKQFVLVSPNIRAITYTPDFVNKEDKWIIEVKGYANDVFPIKWKLFKNLIKDEGYTLFLPSTQTQVRETIQIIKDKFYEN